MADRIVRVASSDEKVQKRLAMLAAEAGLKTQVVTGGWWLIAENDEQLFQIGAVCGMLTNAVRKGSFTVTLDGKVM